MEVIDIGLSDLEPVSMNFSEGPKPTVNFGPGIELLMNDRKRSNSGSGNMNIDLGELDKLENELNELSGESSANKSTDSTTKTFTNFASNLFNFGGANSNTKNEHVSIDPIMETDSKLGSATFDSMGTTKTWDGFSKMNDIPASASSGAKMTDREKRRKKRAMIKKLEEWYEKGHVKNITHFNMDSVYEEVEDEYETCLEDKRKKDSVKLQGWWFMTAINSIEYANTVFNPFDLNLDGWGEQISEDIDSYEEIFSELHEKYKGGKLSPEISLLLRLGFSAAVVNITNKALSTATPGFNDVIKQSPELMKMFTNATVQSMGQQSPGMAFMSNMLNPDEKVNTSFGPPPAPMETKMQPPPARPSMQYTQAPGSRPDISMGRGTMFREGGIDVTSQYESVRAPPLQSLPQMQQERSQRPLAPPMQSQQQSQPQMQSQSQQQSQPQMQSQSQQQSQQRPEMKGPQNLDINNILSGLKTREINIHENTQSTMQPSTFQPPAQMYAQQPQQQVDPIQMTMDDNDSMISVSSLKDMQSGSMPKRTNRRKPKSERNTISLDI